MSYGRLAGLHRSLFKEMFYSGRCMLHLTIYPMIIEPRADLPDDMKENYHFGEIQ